MKQLYSCLLCICKSIAMCRTFKRSIRSYTMASLFLLKNKKRLKHYQCFMKNIQEMKKTKNNSALFSSDSYKISKSEENVEKWTSKEFPWSNNVQNTLQEHFGLTNLKPVQEKAINATLSGEDVLVIMATGGGKSLCYQLPALLIEGITLVISPLISLMHDQVMNLKCLGIPAEMLTANPSRETERKVYEAMETSTNLLLYVSPEKLAKSSSFRAKLASCHANRNLGRIVIDEMHCIVDWGNTFRPDYKIVRILRSQYPYVPIIGLSASCTPKCLVKIKEIIQTPNALVLKTSLNRNNLLYKVRWMPDTYEKIINVMVFDINNAFSGETGIIYCATKKSCYLVCEGLMKHDINCGVYHADLLYEQKIDLYNKWSKGDIQVICATKAFGLGINKLDVRFVFHYQIPESLETYYQESGRAGRDGGPATCVVYFRFSDVFRLYRMIWKAPSGPYNFQKVIDYCLSNTRSCRHKMLIEHMSGEESSCPGNCDLCTSLYKTGSKPVDITSISRTLLKILCNNHRLTGNQLVEELKVEEMQGLTYLDIKRVILHLISCGYFRLRCSPVVFYGPRKSNTKQWDCTYIYPDEKMASCIYKKCLYINFPAHSSSINAL